MIALSHIAILNSKYTKAKQLGIMQMLQYICDNVQS